MAKTNAFQLLSEEKISISALILLGIVELIMLDAVGNYLRMPIREATWFFIAATMGIGTFSATILAWSALKMRLRHQDGLGRGIAAGALVGLASGAGICIFMVLFGLAGIGLEKVEPALVSQQGVGGWAIFYAIASVSVLAAYGAAGAMFGFGTGSIHEWKKKGRQKSR